MKAARVESTPCVAIAPTRFGGRLQPSVPGSSEDAIKIVGRNSIACGNTSAPIAAIRLAADEYGYQESMS
jgi:hypothetical protein